MPNTSPTELARRALAEYTAVMHTAENDAEFRHEVLKTMTRTEVKLDALTERVKDHEDEDRKRFEDRDKRIGTVEQSIGGTVSLKQVAWVGAAVTFVLGVLYFLQWAITHLRPS